MMKLKALAIKRTLPTRKMMSTKSGGCCYPVGNGPGGGTSLANAIAAMISETTVRSRIAAKKEIAPSKPMKPDCFDWTVYSAGKPMRKMSPPIAPIHTSHTGGGPDSPNGPGTNTEMATEMARIKLPTRSANPPSGKMLETPCVSSYLETRERDLG
jgi:hypothetical protein